MNYATGITELRQLLSDSAERKRATKKQIIGKIDGENTTFTTYDKNIFEDTLQVFVNDVEVDASLDDEIAGQIILASAPDKNTKVTATYYFRFWNDDDLTNFLNKGAEATGQFSDASPDKAYLSIQPGLKFAALYFAASMACDSLILYLVNREHAEEFLIQEDGNDDSNFGQMIDALRRMSDSFSEKAFKHRDDFYQRLGKRNAPSFAVKTVASRRYGPIR